MAGVSSLFGLNGSEVLLALMAAVLDSVRPSLSLGAMWATTVQVTLAPLPRPALVQVTTCPLSEQSGAVPQTQLSFPTRRSSDLKTALSDGPRFSTLIV